MDNELILEINDTDLSIDMFVDESVDMTIEEENTVLTGNYNQLVGKPSIEGNQLIGDKTFEDLGLSSLTNSELEELLL